jgi:hypothetical protein
LIGIPVLKRLAFFIRRIKYGNCISGITREGNDTLEEAVMKFILRYFMLIVIVSLLIGTTACEKVDKAFEAVDKAKNLKAEFEKKADEIKKDMSDKDSKSSEGNKKPQKTDKEIKENKGEKD